MDREREAVKEVELVGKDNLPRDTFVDISRRHIREIQEDSYKGKKLIKGKELPWIQNPNGIIRRYCHPLMRGYALDTIYMFVHEIRTHSGKHVHQGGLGLFVLAGKGYTVVDGVRHDWGVGDLILLPVKQGGCEHQHFNVNNQPSRWLALIPTSLRHFVGEKMDQKELHPNLRQ